MQLISFCKQQSIRLIYFVSNSYQKYFFATTLPHKSLWYDVQSFKNYLFPWEQKLGLVPCETNENDRENDQKVCPLGGLFTLNQESQDIFWK